MCLNKRCLDVLYWERFQDTSGHPGALLGKLMWNLNEYLPNLVHILRSGLCIHINYGLVIDLEIEIFSVNL